jgi:hypothetical protein
MSEAILGRSKRKRHWGRHMLVDSWEKLEEVIELIKRSLPVHIEVEFNDSCRPDRSCQPLPFDPRTRTSITFPMPTLAEVRVSLLIDETLGWVMPVQFSVGPLLTAAEIIQKIADACFFLESWSHTHLAEVRGNFRFEHPRSTPSARSAHKPVIQ